MNRLNNKEEKFKEILECSDFEIDTNEVWSSIESKLPSKRRNRIPFFWIMGGLGVFIAGLLIGRFSNSSNSISVANEMAPTTRHINHEKIQPLIGTSPVITLDNENKLHKDEAINLSEEYTLERKGEIEDFFPNWSDRVGYLKSRVGRIVEEYSFKSYLSQNWAISYDLTTSQVREIMMLEKLPTQNGLLVINENSEMPYLNKYHLKPIKKSSFRPFVMATFGFNKAMALSSYNNNSENSFRPFFENESGGYGFSADVSFGTYLTSRLRVKAGLLFNNSNILYQRDGSYDRSHSVYGDEGVYHSANGEDISLQGEVASLYKIDADIRWHRSHKMYDLKLMAGYDVLRFNRLNVSLEAGLAYNIGSTHSGYYFDNSITGLNKFRKGDDHPYKSIGLNPIAGIDLNYRIGKVGFVISAFYKRNNREIINNENYKSRNSQLGVQAGLSYSPSWE